MSDVVSKKPCPTCRSGGRDRHGDNQIVYSDGNTHCFACSTTTFADGNAPIQTTKVKGIEMIGTSGPIKDRKISMNIVDKFKVTLEQDKNGSISRHHYPYFNSAGAIVGTKVRTCDGKNFKTTGTFEGTGLFGQQIWREGGKFITITEGEIDAMAVCEMFDGKWPVVSIKRGSGAAVKDIKESLEWLETYENVIICFDQDDAGRAATDAILPLFSHGKAKVVTLPLKDAGEMLLKGRVRDFNSAWWDARAYRPVDVVGFGDAECWDAFVRRGTEEVIPLPEAYGELNTMMNGGIGAGEITVIGALTSIGKTTMVFNLLYDMAKGHSKRVGAVFLESDIGETIEKIVSIHSGENIALIPAQQRDNEAYKKFYDDFESLSNVTILKHLGFSDTDTLFAKMRWMAIGDDCDVIILDPLHAAVKSNENGQVDEFMDRCLKLAKETGVSIIVVSHMKKPQTKDPHDVNEYDMKGSGSINQIAFNTILLSRDKMAEDEYTSNSTLIQLVKCRRTGRTGKAGWLYYEEKTGRMVQGTEPQIKDLENEAF